MACATRRRTDWTECTGQQWCDLNSAVVQAVRAWCRTYLRCEDASSDNTEYHLISTENCPKRFLRLARKMKTQMDTHRFRWTLLLVLTACLAFAIDALLSSFTSEPTANPSIETGMAIPTANAESNHTITGLMNAIISLSVTNVISVGISLYLYRWRKLLLTRDEILVPEAWGRKLDGFSKANHSIVEAFNRESKILQNVSNDNTAKLDSMIETFMTLQKAVDERDNEIRRLKRGYDQEIFRRFLTRFIRVHQMLGDVPKSDTENAVDIESLRRLLEDAFEECGLEVFQPQLGDDYREVDGIADNPRKETATTAEQEFTIVEVIEQGYRLSGNEQSEVLVPAKVKILVPQ